MKILVATEKPFAPIAVEGIKNEMAQAGHTKKCLKPENLSK